MTSHEFYCSDVDGFVLGKSLGMDGFWQRGIGALSDAAKLALLTYCRRLPGPRVFERSGEMTLAERGRDEGASLLAMAELISILELRASLGRDNSGG